SSLAWNGRVGGKVLAPGLHRLQVSAQDRAGNVSAAGKPVDVVIRYITLSRARIVAKAGTRFGVRVSADTRFRWRLGARSGTAKRGVLVLRAPRERGGAALAVYLAPSGHTKIYAAAAVVGAAGAVGIATVFRRWPWLVAVSALACAPARIPVHVGSTDANLLIPLYAVVAGAAALLAWELVRGDRRTRELGPLTWPLAALVAWTGLS